MITPGQQFPLAMMILAEMLAFVKCDMTLYIRGHPLAA
jgi:hypothetical protein